MAYPPDWEVRKLRFSKNKTKNFKIPLFLCFIDQGLRYNQTLTHGLSPFLYNMPRGVKLLNLDDSSNDFIYGLINKLLVKTAKIITLIMSSSSLSTVIKEEERSGFANNTGVIFLS